MNVWYLILAFAAGVTAGVFLTCLLHTHRDDDDM